MASTSNTRQRRTADKLSPTSHKREDLPPPRPPTKVVNPDIPNPLNRLSLTTVIYSLAGAAVLLSFYYAWIITQWKAEAGGWWNLALGRRPPGMQMGDGNGGGMKGEKIHPFRGDGSGSGGSGSDDVEGRINDLADILGLKPTDLASAISDAVSLHVAPATLSSISSSASAAKGDKTAVAMLVGDEVNAGGGGLGAAAGTAGGVAAGILGTMDRVVGLDEPAGGLD